MTGGTTFARQISATHSSKRGRDVPTTLPSSSTPSSTVPPSRFKKATSSLARSWLRTSSRLNSSIESSPPSIKRASSVGVISRNSSGGNVASLYRVPHHEEGPTAAQSDAAMIDFAHDPDKSECSLYIERDNTGH